MAEKIYQAKDAFLAEALAFVEEELDKAECPVKTAIQITICVEEMFVNVCHYAYGDQEGTVAVSVDIQDGVVTITLKDRGMIFDPLSTDDPDITAPSEERKIGGLGIFLVKKSMDQVYYERKDFCNVFTMVKKLA